MQHRAPQSMLGTASVDGLSSGVPRRRACGRGDDRDHPGSRPGVPSGATRSVPALGAHPANLSPRSRLLVSRTIQHVAGQGRDPSGEINATVHDLRRSTGQWEHRRTAGDEDGTERPFARAPMSSACSEVHQAALLGRRGWDLRTDENETGVAPWPAPGAARRATSPIMWLVRRQGLPEFSLTRPVRRSRPDPAVARMSVGKPDPGKESVWPAKRRPLTRSRSRAPGREGIAGGASLPASLALVPGTSAIRVVSRRRALAALPDAVGRFLAAEAAALPAILVGCEEDRIFRTSTKTHYLPQLPWPGCSMPDPFPPHCRHARATTAPRRATARCASAIHAR